MSATRPDPLAEIGAALDNPAPAPAMAAPGDRVRDHGDDGDDDEPFPLDCPVAPLGVQSSIDGSQRCYYLNVNGEIVSLEAGNKHGKNNLIHLFGKKAKYLEQAWTRWTAPKKEYSKAEKRWIEIEASRPDGFDQAKASQALIMECSRKGIFDPVGRLRGRGAHPLPGGGLALHCGDGLAALLPSVTGKLQPMQWFDTGLHDKLVYPEAMAIPRPWATSPPAREVIKLSGLLTKWYWKRPLLDPILALGAIGQGFISGALPWRSNVWITGGAGTGKSSLNGPNGLIPRIYGEGLFRTGNTSAAAIRQMLRNSTVPVMIDEAEPGANGDNRKITEVVELARVASSGDKIHRGGQDHQAHEFTMQSAFWFSSINIPPMEAADRSRLAILELRTIPEDAALLDLDAYDFPSMGRQLFRRMVDAWPVLAATKKLFHQALAKSGHRSRACDQFGTLLACAWLLMEGELPADDDVHEWVQLCLPERLSEVSDAISDEEACLSALLTHHVQPRGRDSREAISTLIGRAVAEIIKPLDAMGGAGDAPRKALEQFGVKLVNLHWVPAAGDKPGRWGAVQAMAGEPIFLAIAASGKPMAEIYAGSKYTGGVHRQTLARIEGARDGITVKIASTATRTVMVPLAAVLHESELPAMSKPEAAQAWLAEQQGAEA